VDGVGTVKGGEWEVHASSTVEVDGVKISKLACWVQVPG
jgi:hypothetical protein